MNNDLHDFKEFLEQRQEEGGTVFAVTQSHPVASPAAPSPRSFSGHQETLVRARRTYAQHRSREQRVPSETVTVA